MAGKRKRGDSWEISWYEEGRQKKKSYCVTEAEAEAIRLTKERQLDGTLTAAGPAFNTWALEYCTWHHNEYPDSYFRIEQIVRCHLLPVFGHLPLGLITPREVEAWKRARAKATYSKQHRAISPATVAKELRVLQAILNKAVEWEVIPKNPIHNRVRPPQDTRDDEPFWYSKDELKLIYKTAAEYHSWWRLLANTGLRRAELYNLRRRHIGEDSLRVISTSDNRTKSRKWRHIPLSKGAQKALDAIQPKDWVAPQVHPSSLSRAFIRDARRAGLEGSLHCLRHTYCSHLAMAGKPMRAIQLVAGHSTLKVTERYAHLAPDYQQQTVVNL